MDRANLQALRSALKNGTSDPTNANLDTAKLSSVTFDSSTFGYTSETFLSLFKNCTALKAVTFPATDQTVPVKLADTFYGCTSLTTVTNLTHLKQVTDFSGTFRSCSGLVSVELPVNCSSYSVQSTSFNATFQGCTSLTAVTNFETFTNVINFQSTFQGCTSLITMTLPASTIASNTSFINTFSGCLNLQSVNNLEHFNNILNFSGCFNACSKLTSITLCPTGTNQTAGIDFSNTFNGCTLLPYSAIQNIIHYTNVGSFRLTFQGCVAMPVITLPEGSSLNGVSFEGAFQNCTTLVSVVNLDKFTGISSFKDAFHGCSQLPSVTFRSVATTYSGNVSLEKAFMNCTMLTAVNNLENMGNLSSFDEAFRDCINLTTLTLPANNNTATVTFNRAFYNCHRLVTLNNLERFKNVSSWYQTFYACYMLTAVQLSNLPNYLDNAFDYANPNMLKYLPIGQSAIPAAWSSSVSSNMLQYYNNFIQGESSDENPVAYGDIVLVDVHSRTNPTESYIAPFNCPVAFTLKSGNRARYTRDFSGQFTTDGVLGFQSLILPFDVTEVSNKTLQRSPCLDTGLDNAKYFARRYVKSEDDNMLFKNIDDRITANVPHIVMFKSGSTGNNVIFLSPLGATIAATPASLATVDANAAFNYGGNFLGIAATVAKYYIETKPTYDAFVLKTLADGRYTYPGRIESIPFRAAFVDNLGSSTYTELKIGYIDNLWLGTVSDDWGDYRNWTEQFVPCEYYNIVYADQSSVANNLVLDKDRNIGKLTNTTTFSTVVPAGKSLHAWDNVTGYETAAKAGKLHINANATQPNGSFIVNCAKQNVDVFATVEMYSSAYRNPTQLLWTDNISGSPTEGSTIGGYYIWQYFGLPVEQVGASPTFNGSYIREYDEALNGSSYYQKWQQLQNGDVMSKFKGYEVTQNIAQGVGKKFTIQGKLVICDQPITLTAHAAEASNGVRYGMGYNIFGNSFTSAIPIEQLTFPVNVEQTVYLYNTGAFSAWGDSHSSMADPTAALAGSYKAIPKNTSSITAYKNIPSMNGFLLLYNGAYGTQTTMTLPYASVVKNVDRQTAPRAPLSYLDIELSSTSTTDRLLLISEPGTTSGFDDGWDGRKFFGTPTAYIYAPTSDGNMEISTNSTLIGTYINFVGNNETDYTLSIKKSNIDQHYSGLSLIDLFTGEITLLNDEVTEYTFTASNVGTADQRFMISGAPGVITDEKTPNMDGSTNTFVVDGTLFVNNTNAYDATLHLFDAVGRKLYSGIVPTMSVEELPISLSDGVYLISVIAGKEVTSTKIVVNK